MTQPLTMGSAELRARFLDYFRRHGHEVVGSSSLVPGNDPTLLFTNAGMVQFKDVFLGKDRRSYTRAATSQRCVRAGGKHNDLENVGYTARHHTFFEMLGNFSFGDYFKHDAIRFAWGFITSELKIPASRLWVTVYETDDEAHAIWLNEIGVSPDRITRLGAASNFWSMGETGPCGPCTEIFYDHGEQIAGGPPGSPDEDGDRYVEIWNLVFMQYERDASGALTPLPKPSVDTGMGLERISAVIQGVHSNYDIDLFKALIEEAARVTQATDLASPSLRVIADHIRATSFLIVDGVVPSNDGRGYVLRRIIRRAVRHGHKLGHTRPFLHLLVPALVKQMGESYPELAKAASRVAGVLLQEEERFAERLVQGMALLEAAFARIDGTVLAGDTAFKLYDTYGFPLDLTADIARERGLTVDHAGFEAAMNAQRERARAASRFGVDLRETAQIDANTRFEGYTHLEWQATVMALLDANGASVGVLEEGSSGRVVLDATPFYAESGGQVGDQGELVGVDATFVVEDTQKLREAFAHVGVLRGGSIKVGDSLRARVDAERRLATARNHSATHLLHSALQRTLGEHVQQKGSLVGPERLRFDYSHGQALTDAQRAEIEALVNTDILLNVATQTRVMGFDEAMAAGATGLFGEKYGAQVRVLDIGPHSTELCGGTHVSRTGDMGMFKIVTEGGVSAGVRRIEAVTGKAALEHLNSTERSLDALARELRCGRADAPTKVLALIERTRKLEKEIERLNQKLTQGSGTDLAAAAVVIGEARVVVSRLEGADAKALRAAVDQLKAQLVSTVVVLASVAQDGRITLVAGVTENLTAKVQAGALVGVLAAQLGGKGGGRADFAQAGGTDVAGLDAALATVPGYVEARLQA